MAERPRERMHAYALERIGSLSARASMECQEPTCGARDEEGNLVSCASANCGEKLMLPGWRRELQVMRDLRTLIEWLERDELEKVAAADKAKAGRGKR